MKKAAFLDRDGVINGLVHYEEHGLIDSPFTFEQFKILDGVKEAIRKIKGKGYEVIIVSNQPGVAKGFFGKDVLEKIDKKMNEELDIDLDNIYYCVHHPQCSGECDCRKPKPGLILKAAKEHGIDIKNSIMVGDGWSDVKAGKNAGCKKNILIGRNNKCDLCRILKENDVFPDAFCLNLKGVIKYL